MKASEVVFQKLLDGKIQYIVPLYQRTYNWEERQWEQLWDDIFDIYVLSPQRNHFIGSVVTQLVPSAPEGVSKYTLIDGQQRMTTLFILLSVIRKHAKAENCGNLAEEIEDTCLVNKYGDGDERIKLIPTQRDQKAFQSVVNGNGETPPAETQIGKAWKYFNEKMKGGDSNGSRIDLKKLHQCIVNHLDMVSISLEKEDSPNRIFESLNNTGMPLSVADLIRNYLLMNIKDLGQQEQAYDKYWHPMEKPFPDSNIPTTFFWHYLMMDGSLPRQDDTYEKVQQQHLTHPIPEESVIELMEDFAKFSRYYVQITGIDTSDLDAPLTKQIQRLNQWEVAVVYPFLMRAMDKVSTGVIKQDDLIEVMRLIESFVIRRTVCGIPTNQLRKIFARMSGQVDFDNFVGSSKNHLLKNDWPSDDDFYSHFVKFPLYSHGGSNRTKLVLRTLETSFDHKESPEQTDEVTTEHIMPQTLTPEWSNELGEDATEIHGRLLHTIGNLTLSGYNHEMSNKPFTEKKNFLAESNFALSASIKHLEVWNETSILDRGKELAKRALQIWRR